ncbi:hypothetical protein PAAG_11723 [Paracoccidioides lutzii Pb01]|uniref:Uncharacterized protein n=1 Tax=Paracoccidioides lutzii (strain ATCC MYA-826 / Pb01) TaxID=502779 RepID=A0A0A2V673_PARBA|nr:hypothetical protein PAAG_11723 [Paracoccidioides lutzii Pb01]KGQ01595.1 hypothetical protein PAAG_11723 [Paracoccidioides lutzii Pb01]
MEYDTDVIGICINTTYALLSCPWQPSIVPHQGLIQICDEPQTLALNQSGSSIQVNALLSNKRRGHESSTLVTSNSELFVQKEALHSACRRAHASLKDIVPVGWKLNLQREIQVNGRKRKRAWESAEPPAASSQALIALQSGPSI